MQDITTRPSATLSDPAPDPGADVNLALAEAMPDLRRTTWTGWGIQVALGVLALVLILNVRVKDGGQIKFVFFVLLFWGVFAYLSATYTRRRHEALVLPVLSRSAGFSYQQNARHYVQGLPTRLLPRGAVRRCEDLVEGAVGGRRIAFGEVRIETGGKNSSVLFKGVVARYANEVQMPPFFIAAEKETRGWFVFKGNIDVDGLSYIRTISGRQDSYGVWSQQYRVADEPGFEALLAAIFKAEAVLDFDSRLYSASSDGRNTHVAIRHKRDLFRLGGLFANRDTLEDEIRRAHHDLLLPVKVVEVLLDAEAKTLAESREKGGNRPDMSQA